MPPRRKGEKRERHGTRPLIVKVFEDPGAPESLTTTAIVELVSKAAGTKIPEFSVYSALRTLVKRKVLKASRVGHEKSYTYVGAGAPNRASVTSEPIMPPSPHAPSEAPPMVLALPPAPAGPTPAPLPHKLAVGEALILHVGEEHVESVTNVHGHLVVERHPRDRRPTG